MAVFFNDVYALITSRGKKSLELNETGCSSSGLRQFLCNMCYIKNVITSLSLQKHK